MKTYPAVAPRAGAWIEAYDGPTVDGPTGSLPVRERGLKLLALLLYIV